MNITVSIRHTQFIHFCANRNRDAYSWISAIYGNPQEQIRRQLWEELSRLATSFAEPWMLIGDLNDIASMSEK